MSFNIKIFYVNKAPKAEMLPALRLFNALQRIVLESAEKQDTGRPYAVDFESLARDEEEVPLTARIRISIILKTEEQFEEMKKCLIQTFLKEKIYDKDEAISKEEAVGGLIKVHLIYVKKASSD